MVSTIVHVVMVSVLVIGICNCQSIYNASDLIDDLLTNYKTVLRPTINQSRPIHVNFSMEIISIIEFNEVRGSLIINAVLAMFWTDERMVWNSSQYDGISHVMIESNKVWTPMVVHINTIEKTEKVGSDDPWQLIRFTNNGWAHYYPGGVFISSCTADVTYYPFDSHTCMIEFVSWGFVGTEIQLLPMSNEVQQNYYSPSGIWLLTESNMETFYQNIQIMVTLKLERKPLFVIFNVILPIVLMALLNTLVFIIPIDSGERISYSLTMLLAVAVFLTLVGDNLPKTSSQMSIFSYYLLLILTLCVIFVGVNILSLRCYFAKEKEHINNHWKRLVKISRLKLIGGCRKNSVRDEGRQIDINTSADIQHNPTKKLHTDMKPDRNRMAVTHGDTQSVFTSTEQVEADDNTITWKVISCAVDRVSFIVSLTLTLGTTLVFLVVIYARSNAFNDK